MGRGHSGDTFHMHTLPPNQASFTLPGGGGGMKMKSWVNLMGEGGRIVCVWFSLWLVT